MLVLGLTGSVGMGKSTVAAMFAEAGVPVFDADRCVHALYRGAAAPLVEAAFPGTVLDGVVDRARLGAHVLGNGEALRRLEGIVHPLVKEAEIAFRREAALSGRRMIVLDHPLLLEQGGRDRVDAVIVVTADPAVQKARVLARPGMTEEKFQRLAGYQMPDSEKRRRAHFIIENSGTLAATRRQVGDILRALAATAAGT
jgi:dephospho-CoA kinase